jgi:IclR family transcriptional regulator, pca regulon regulatory protein
MPMEADVNPRNLVHALAKGLRVLESFAADAPELTLSEVARRADLDPGTAFRMLATLAEAGYVERVPGSRRFRLGLRVLDLGFSAIARMDLREVARPILRSLVGEVNEAASLGVLDGPRVLFVERVRAGLVRLGVDIRVGTTLPAYHTAIGHAMLAFLPDEVVDDVLARSPASPGVPYAPSDRARIEHAFATVRRTGIALIDGTAVTGLRVLAAPVRDVDGLAVAAISVTAPPVRMPLAEFEALVAPPVRDAATRIGRALQASGTTAVAPPLTPLAAS